MTIAIGSDHAGYELKEEVKKYLESKGIQVQDQGVHSSERADYPDYAHAVADHVSASDDTLGIVICGSGNGINMAANKHGEIRSALCWKPEIAALARQHNDANVLALPARFISNKEAISIVNEFLSAEFEGGRHAARVDKINKNVSC